MSDEYKFDPGYTQHELDIIHTQQRRQAGMMLRIQTYLDKRWLRQRIHQTYHKKKPQGLDYYELNCKHCRSDLWRAFKSLFKKVIW